MPIIENRMSNSYSSFLGVRILAGHKNRDKKMYKNGQNKRKLCKILVLMALNTVTLDVPIEYPGMPIVKTRVSKHYAKDYSPSM